MLENFQRCEPLSQVWFVLDYVQVRFGECVLTVKNVMEVEPELGHRLREGQRRFCDALVGLIGSRIMSFELIAGEAFTLRLDRNRAISVLLSRDAVRGPEAFEVSGPPVAAALGAIG